MMRNFLARFGWPWFRPSLADLRRLSEARRTARQRVATAHRQRHAAEAQRAHVRATASLLAAEIGRKA